MFQTSTLTAIYMLSLQVIGPHLHELPLMKCHTSTSLSISWYWKSTGWRCPHRSCSW